MKEKDNNYFEKKLNLGKNSEKQKSYLKIKEFYYKPLLNECNSTGLTTQVIAPLNRNQELQYLKHCTYK